METAQLFIKFTAVLHICILKFDEGISVGGHCQKIGEVTESYTVGSVFRGLWQSDDFE
jgi:hypothetical protein